MIVIAKTQDDFAAREKYGRPPKNSSKNRKAGKRGKGIKGERCINDSSNNNPNENGNISVRTPAPNLKYTPADHVNVVQNVLALIADGWSIPQIVEKSEVSKKVITNWIINDKHGAGVAYMRAREARADRVAREVMDIADNCPVNNPVAVNKARLQTDVRKWWLSHILPEKYGDLQRLELTGKGGGAIGIQAVGAVAIEDAQRLRTLIFGPAAPGSVLPATDAPEEVIDTEAEEG